MLLGNAALFTMKWNTIFFLNSRKSSEKELSIMFTQKIRKMTITIFSLILLSPLAIRTVSAAESNKTVDYVALGDSLAAGQKPTAIGSTSAKLYGTSYPKFIRDDLSGKGMLNSYANFGVSGYQTWQIFGDLYDPNSATHKAILEAEIITLDIGANDLLASLQVEEGDVSQLLLALDATDLTQVGGLVDQAYFQDLIVDVASEVGGIVAQMKTMNPEAEIYVMGYYNAFSFLSDYTDDPELQEKISILLPMLTGLIGAYNVALEHTTNEMSNYYPGITYVSTWEAMGGDLDSNARTYLPLDIHPTVQGYRAIAQAFWDEMSK